MYHSGEERQGSVGSNGWDGTSRLLLPNSTSWKLRLQTEIHIDGDNNYYEVSTYSTAPATAPLGSGAEAGPSTIKAGLEKKALEKAEINLNDCLACR